ncbi:hypothetical protein RDWZM_004351 [Blomia tropicalis]|uniref:Protein kinase domain-containing protein n=1 Tax=Blomia tropicalis TaxID=40697 RepID=A0A9Q0RTT9_BLOTA|nr:hypothetical protein RDWZM_004351 [Blomia tropicalis]
MNSNCSPEYRKQVIAVCCQDDVHLFEQRFPSVWFTKFSHLDSGSYSRVFISKSCFTGKEYVTKMIKLHKRKVNKDIHSEDLKSKSKYQSSAEDKLLEEHYGNVFQEIVIVKCLSNMHITQCNINGHSFRVHCFPKIYQTGLVTGRIPFDKESIETSHEYVAICMEHCGISLRKAAKKLSLKQVASICYQLLLGMAAAEQLYEYEHRDLHLANILVRKTKSEKLNFVFQSSQYQVQTYGIRAFIIDNTFARMRLGNQIYYTRLSDKLERKWLQSLDDDKRKELTEQDMIYVRMHNAARDNWSQWLKRTNLYWLNHIVVQLINHKQILPQADKDQSTFIELKYLENCLTNYESLYEVVQNIFNLSQVL